jgi:uncharacterized repeat protein (TIGR04076 family)
MRYYKCKTTVLKRELYEDLRDQYVKDQKTGKCSFFSEGQEFIVSSKSYFSMLDGKFCSYAWDAINKWIYAAIQGGPLMPSYMNDEKTMIACCNDGVRPVIFKIERI